MGPALRQPWESASGMHARHWGALGRLRLGSLGPHNGASELVANEVLGSKGIHQRLVKSWESLQGSPLNYQELTKDS